MTVRSASPFVYTGHPSTRFEDEASAQGATRIAGIDEAGRGPLAGPVVAAAVILKEPDSIPAINDSKLLDADKRDALYQQIRTTALGLGVGIVETAVIDRINIYQATRLAMKNAVLAMNPAPDFLLIDGNLSLDLPISQKAIIKGDRLSFSVAAAGIIAKVTRDRLMMELHEKYPQYGFDRHKGYATRTHREALLEHGPCPVHRTCFKGVKELLGPQDPDQVALFDDQSTTAASLPRIGK